MENDLASALLEMEEHILEAQPKGPKGPQGTPPAAAAAADDRNEPKPEKVTFDERQQERVNELIKRAQGRAAKELRAENEALKQRLSALERAQPQMDDATRTLATRLATVEAERDALTRAQKDAQLDTMIRQAAGDAWVNSDLAIRIMRDHVRLGEDGKPVVVDDSGAEWLNEEFSPMSLSDLSRTIGEKHPYLLRSQVKGGIGSAESARSTLTDVPREKLAQLFGRNSDSRLANELARKDYRTYSRLKEAARKEGLI